MELLPVIKQLAELGFTVPVIVAIRILWQINAKFVNHDRRITVLEVLQQGKAEK